MQNKTLIAYVVGFVVLGFFVWKLADDQKAQQQQIAADLAARIAAIADSVAAVRTEMAQLHRRQAKRLHRIEDKADDLKKQLAHTSDRLNTKIGHVRYQTRKVQDKTDALTAQLRENTAHLNRRLGLLEYRTNAIRQHTRAIKRKVY